MEINRDLVERVARARYDTIHDSNGMPWSDQCASIRNVFTEMSRVWLHAAADAGLLTGYAYRAERDSIPLGTYTTLAAAQDHCLRELRDAVDLEGWTPGWVPDHGGPDAITDLCIFGDPDDEGTTGYTVTPIELLAAFDPNAEG